MGSISIREHIRWLADGEGEAGEPTDTVVLTSPGRRFVDVRILKDVTGVLLYMFCLPSPCSFWLHRTAQSFCLFGFLQDLEWKL